MPTCPTRSPTRSRALTACGPSRKQTAGQRTWDINVDGVAQYGLYPDWVEDLRKVAGKDGDAIIEDMARGAEAYLQTWERAEGIRPDSCRNANLRKSVTKVGKLIRPGMTTKKVMKRPSASPTRAPLAPTGSAPRHPGKKKVKMVVTFTKGGKVKSLRRKGAATVQGRKSGPKSGPPSGRHRVT